MRVVRACSTSSGCSPSQARYLSTACARDVGVGSQRKGLPHRDGRATERVCGGSALPRCCWTPIGPDLRCPGFSAGVGSRATPAHGGCWFVHGCNRVGAGLCGWNAGWTTPGSLEAVGSGKDQEHGRVKKYPVELKQRAVAMVDELEREFGPGRGAIARVAAQLGVYPEVLRYWVRQDQKGVRPSGERVEGSESEKDARFTELERELRELRRANEILRLASAFSRGK